MTGRDEEIRGARADVRRPEVGGRGRALCVPALVLVVGLLLPAVAGSVVAKSANLQLTALSVNGGGAARLEADPAAGLGPASLSIGQATPLGTSASASGAIQVELGFWAVEQAIAARGVDCKDFCAELGTIPTVDLPGIVVGPLAEVSWALSADRASQTWSVIDDRGNVYTGSYKTKKKGKRKIHTLKFDEESRALFFAVAGTDVRNLVQETGEQVVVSERKAPKLKVEQIKKKLTTRLRYRLDVERESGKTKKGDLKLKAKARRVKEPPPAP